MKNITFYKENYRKTYREAGKKFVKSCLEVVSMFCLASFGIGLYTLAFI